MCTACKSSGHCLLGLLLLDQCHVPNTKFPLKGLCKTVRRNPACPGLMLHATLSSIADIRHTPATKMSPSQTIPQHQPDMQASALLKNMTFAASLLWFEAHVGQPTSSAQLLIGLSCTSDHNCCTCVLAWLSQAPVGRSGSGVPAPSAGLHSRPDVQRLLGVHSRAR